MGGRALAKDTRQNNEGSPPSEIRREKAKNGKKLLCCDVRYFLFCSEEEKTEAEIKLLLFYLFIRW
jgi:hypothetical protein